MRLQLGLMLLLLCGCVPKGKHELVEVQLDATRTAMSARQGACIEQTSALNNKVFALEDEVAARQLQLDRLTERTGAIEAELEALRAEKTEWARIDLPSPPEPRRGRKPPPEPEEVVELRAAKAAALEEIEEALAQASSMRITEERRMAHHQAVVDAFGEIIREGWGEVLEAGDATAIRVPIHILFQENRVLPSPRGDMVMQRIAVALRELEGRTLTIEGHTDKTPYNSVRFPSNWELGFGYAAMVLRTLAAEGVPMQPTAASFAGARPLDEGDTPAAHKTNRRIELVLRSDPNVEIRFAPTEETPGEPDSDTQPDPDEEPASPEPAKEKSRSEE